MHKAMCNTSSMFAGCSCSLPIFLVLSVHKGVVQGEKHVHYIAQMQFILIKLCLIWLLRVVTISSTY